MMNNEELNEVMVVIVVLVVAVNRSEVKKFNYECFVIMVIFLDIYSGKFIIFDKEMIFYIEDNLYVWFWFLEYFY